MAPGAGMHYTLREIYGFRDTVTNRGVTFRLPEGTFTGLRKIGLLAIRATARGKRAGRRKLRKPSNTLLCRQPLSLTDCMKIAHLNVHSAADDRKADQVKGLIIDNSLDICALTETWFKERHSSVNVVVPAGYALKHIPRSTRGGGVAVIYRDTLTVTSGKPCEYQAMECLECLIATNSQSVRFVVIYRPPPKKGTPNTAVFLKEFNDLLNDLTLSSGRLLMVGDLNFHFENLSDPATKRTLDTSSLLPTTNNTSFYLRIEGVTLWIQSLPDWVN